MSSAMLSSPVVRREISGCPAVRQRIARELAECLTDAAVLQLTSCINLDFARDILDQEIVKQGDKLGMSRSEIASNIGRCPAWAYAADKRPARLPNARDLFLDEEVFDRIQSAGRKSISELAIDLSINEKDLRPVISEMLGKYLRAVPGIAPDSFEIMDGVFGVNHGYPVNLAERYKRMLGADIVAKWAKESAAFSFSAALNGKGADDIYSMVRNYDLTLFPEELLNRRLQESKERGQLSESSRFGVVLLFSRDVEYDGAIAHYVQCKNKWYEQAYEMVPYRYALDDVAIEQFMREDRERLMEESNELLSEAAENGGQQTGERYRLTLLCAKYAA